MIFGPTRLHEAVGAVLAHTLRLSGLVLRKGVVLDVAAVAALRANGIGEVIAARLEPGDLGEDQAADRLGQALLPPLVEATRAATGRVNLRARVPGLLLVDAARVDGLNRVDEALTVATLPNPTPVAIRDMLATIKVIPFAVSGHVVEAAERLARAGAALRLVPFRPLRVGLVLTLLPGLKDSVVEGTIEATAGRVHGLSGTLLPPERCPHETAAVAAALRRLIDAGADLLLVAGASAVVDRRDIGPAGIEAAGGEILHFGMPVDPGNLICLGRVGDLPALVLPGCARSPKPNGIDQVLWRLFAGLDVDAATVTGMGVGGLLKEGSRPLPRGQAELGRLGVATLPHAPARVAAVVLAAARPRRTAPSDPLPAPEAGGQAMVARVVDAVLGSAARPVIVVLGHPACEVERALAGRPVRFVHAAGHGEGLSRSLWAGIVALPMEASAALICRCDMPVVTARMLDRLIEAFDPDEGRSIVVPTVRGRPGHPVLWGRGWFADIAGSTDDAEARVLLATLAEHVVEVEVGEDPVPRDLDVPEDHDPG